MVITRILPWNPPALRPYLQNSLSQDRPKRNGAFNIASILCLSMLFSKISRKISRTPLRRTLPQRSTHRPIMGSLNDHSHIAQSRLRIKRVIYTIAHFSALSNAFPKFFQKFFGPAQTPLSRGSFASLSLLRRTPAPNRTDII